MASLDVIRTLTIQAKTQGVDESTNKLRALNQAGKEVTETSVSQEKATLSVEKAYQRLARQFDEAYRAQENLAKVQKTLQQAQDQGVITQKRANELMQMAIVHYNSASTATKAFTAAQQAVNSEMQAFASRAGAVGQILVALGPAGLAAAAAIGALTLGLKFAADAALQLADKAGKLRDFAETTGFTVEQLQALQFAGAQVGITAEKVSQGLERFSVAFEEIKTSSGNAFQTLKQIDPVLAGQIARADSLTKAYDLYTEALAKADLTQRNLLARQVGGRGGIETTRLANAVQQAGGVDALTAAVNRLDKITAEQAKTWDDLGDAINENLEKIKNNLVSTFAGPVLENLKNFTERLLEFSRSVKSFDWEGSWFVKFASWANYVTGFVNPLQQLYRAVSNLAGVGGTPLQVSVGSAGVIGPQLPPERARELADLAAKQQFLRDETVRTANEYRAFVTVLGGAATPAQRLKDQLLQLDKAMAENGDATTRAAVAQAKSVLQANFSMDQENARIGLLGNLATVTDAVTLAKNKLTKAEMDGIVVSKQQREQLLSIAELQAKASKSSAAVSALGEAATTTEKYQAQVDELNVKLADTTITQDQFNKKLLMLNPVMVGLKDAVTDLGDALAQAFLKGQSAADAMQNSLQAIASKATTSAITNLLSGNFSGAAISGGIALGAGLLSNLFGGGKEAEEAQRRQAEEAKRAADELKRAQEAWAAMSDELERFNREAKGLGTGALRTAIDQIRETQRTLTEAAKKANDAAGSAGVGATAVASTLRLLNKFAADLPGSIAALSDTGSIRAAREAVKSLMDQFNDLSDSMAFFAENTGADMTQAFADLQASGQKALLAMLDVPKPLSETATQLADLTAKAGAMQDALVQLGMSAEDAANAINTKLNVALEALRANFIEDLIRKVNELAGGSFINEAQDLFNQVQQLRADAASLGIATSLIDTFYVLSAQKIIDQNQLVGTQFNALVNTLGLAGAGLHEFNAAVQTTAQVATRSAQDIANAVQTNQDRLVRAQHTSGSLADSLALFDLQAQREREAEIAAGGQAIASLEAALAKERLNIISDFNARALEEQKQAAAAAAQVQQQAQQRIASFSDQLFALGQNQNTLAGRLAVFDRQAQRDRQQEAAAGGQALVALEALQSAQRIQIVQDFYQQQAQIAQAAAQRVDAAADRLYRAQHRTDSLGDQLALFDLQAMRDRQAEAQAGGQAMVALDRALAQERLNIIADYNAKALEEQKRAQDEAQRLEEQRLADLRETAKKISDYINGILVGPQSSLSPANRLRVAQGTFEQQLRMAQGGDLDAQKNITQSAEDFRQAARDFYGSSAAFQNIQNDIINSLQGLPVMRQATDPVVVATQDTTLAVNQTTEAVQQTTQAVNQTTAAIIYLKDAIDKQTDQLAREQRFSDRKGAA